MIKVPSNEQYKCNKKFLPGKLHHCKEKKSSNRVKEEDTVMNHDVIPCHSTRRGSLVQKSSFTVPPVMVIVEERTTKFVFLYLHGFILHSNL